MSGQFSTNRHGKRAGDYVAARRLSHRSGRASFVDLPVIPPDQNVEFPESV